MSETTSLVERVARALAKVGGSDPDELIQAIPDGPRDFPVWGCYEPEARAAIEAMHGPTDAMIDAGAVADREHGTMTAIFNAMISAALATEETP